MREDWIEKELGKVCFTTSGGTPSRKVPDYYEGDIPWVKSGELNHNVIRDTEEHISEEAVKNSSAKIFPEGTLLIALYGATIGKLAVLGVPATTNQAVCGIFKNGVFETKFLFNYLFHKKQKLIEQGAGGAQPNISQTILKKLPVPLAPLPEQRAIVAKIEQLFSELDNGIANLKAAKDKLEIYRQAVLKKAFEGELTNSKIIYDRIGEYVSIISGNAFKKAEYSIEGVRLFQIANVSFNEIVWDKKAYLPSDYLLDPKIQHLILKEGDIVMALNRPMLNNRLKIGRLSKNDVPSILYQRVGKFVFQGEINPKYFLYFLQSSDFTKWLSEELRGVNIPFINQTKLLSFDKLPIVDLSIQNAIVQEIESRLSVCDNILANIEEGLEKSEALRQSILKQAFEGKLLSEDELEACRREPDWEPAEKLLERIKNEKLAKA
jgi:type I restriction enzyme S subunit